MTNKLTSRAAGGDGRLSTAIDRASTAVDAAEDAVDRISEAHYEADLTLARSEQLLRELTAVQEERHPTHPGYSSPTAS